MTSKGPLRLPSYLLFDRVTLQWNCDAESVERNHLITDEVILFVAARLETLALSLSRSWSSLRDCVHQQHPPMSGTGRVNHYLLNKRMNR